MKYMNMKRFGLQLFADGDGNGSNGGASNGNDGGDGDTGNSGDNHPMSFDDFLATDGMQAEFDRRTQKAIKTAVDNAQKKWKTLTDSKVSEAEKLAQMTSEEKEKYRADKAERELAELKKDIELRDMAGTARKMLSEEQISVSDDIIRNLVSDDAEKTKTAVQAFASAFKDAVQAGIKEALKGNPPKQGSAQTGLTKEKIMSIQNRAERQRLIAENADLWR